MNIQEFEIYEYKDYRVSDRNDFFFFFFALQPPELTT